jgi:hypothetical protein
MRTFGALEAVVMDLIRRRGKPATVQASWSSCQWRAVGGQYGHDARSAPAGYDHRVNGRRRSVTHRGISLRLWLLLLVTAGVFGMHTLGHAHSPMASHGSESATLYAAGMLSVGIHARPDADRRANEGDHQAPLTDPTDMCIAILVAALIAVLVAASRRYADSGGSSRALLSSVAGVRGPPLRPLIGLIVADLAVLRN